MMISVITTTILPAVRTDCPFSLSCLSLIYLHAIIIYFDTSVAHTYISGESRVSNMLSQEEQQKIPQILHFILQRNVYDISDTI